MSVTKLLIVLLGASVLLSSEEERVWLGTPAVTWAAEVALKPKEVFRDKLKIGGNGPEMVVVPQGSFEMGDQEGRHDLDELPVHTVNIEKPFAIGRYEITFDEYDRHASAIGRKPPDDVSWGRGRRPVIKITWQEAKNYTEWLSEQTGKRYRLSTEAEWEYAARAGTKTRYWWGNDLVKDMANCDGCGSQWDKKQTAPVGSFKPNAFGLYDTAGNVFEWVQDCWHKNYKGAPVDGSAWLEAGGGDCERRMIRGGSWSIDTIHQRPAHRHGAIAATPVYTIGFRVVRELE